MIAAETANLNKLLEKKDVLDAKINTSKQKLDRYKLLQNNAQYNALSDTIVNSGLNVDDIIAEFSSGDLISLQNKLLQAQDTISEDQAVMQHDDLSDKDPDW